MGLPTTLRWTSRRQGGATENFFSSIRFTPIATEASHSKVSLAELVDVMVALPSCLLGESQERRQREGREATRVPCSLEWRRREASEAERMEECLMNDEGSIIHY